MPRLAVAIALVWFFAASCTGQTADAVSAARVSQIRVLVLLRGTPTASQSQFLDSTRATGSRARFDGLLSAARDYSASLDRYQKAEFTYLSGLGIKMAIGHRFHTVLNGFGVTIDVNDVPKLRRAQNVAAVVPERQYSLQLDRSVGLVNAPQAWAELGGTSQAGRGTYIADIDSGIDIKNPCFRDAGFSRPQYGLRTDTVANERYINNKVVVARAFGNSGDKQYSAQDVQGHGTFTASIEACDAGTQTAIGNHISGVAPGAYLMNYNVFPAGSSGPYDDQVIAALDSALLDGADVANISLGSPQGIGDLGLDPESAAVQSAERAGLTVVVAAGNAGPTAQSISSPGGAPDAITVGAVTNSGGLYSSVSVLGSAQPSGALTSIKARQGSFVWSGNIGPAPMAYVGLGRKPGDDTRSPTANDYAGKDLHGKIAVIERGNGGSTSLLTIRKKVSNASGSGAIGVLLFDNRDEPELPQLDQGPSRLPLSFITRSDGQKIITWLGSHPSATAIMNSSLTVYDETPAVLTDFSSRGYGPDYAIKPDIVAPGEDVYAATETSNPSGDMYDPSGFTSQNGTSFAAPHVAGAAALLRQRHPRWTGAMVKAALVDTASTSVWSDPLKLHAPTVMEVGAGLLDVASAIDASAIISPSQLSFGEVNTAYGTVERTAGLSLQDVGTGAGSWALAFHQLHGKSHLNLTLPGSVNLSVNGQAHIQVQILASAGILPGDYDGYVLASRGGETIHVPFFAHVVHQNVGRATTLLVDDTASRFQANPTAAVRSDARVASVYERALRALKRSFTYWDEAKLGPPAVSDMQRTGAVIYFTGNNLNGYASANQDPDALAPPLGPIDLSNLRAYLAGGGRVFLTGMGAALSDPYWLATVMGAQMTAASVFDNASNDRSHTGGLSPGRPSAIGVSDPNAPQRSGLFAGMKAIDLSNRGDGLHDNRAIYNSSIGFVGVAGLKVVQGTILSNLQAHGHAALRPFAGQGATQIATTSNDEPSLNRPQGFRGRSVFFSFGFEGINDNTGYSTRAQVLRRILRWLADSPRVAVAPMLGRAGLQLRLRAEFSSTQGAAPVTLQWEIGRRSHPTVTSKKTIVLTQAARYPVRVRVVDSLGHAAVSGWSTLTIR